MKILKTKKELNAGLHRYVEYRLRYGKRCVVQRDKIDFRYWHVFWLATTEAEADKTLFTGRFDEAVKFARSYIKAQAESGC